MSRNCTMQSDCSADWHEAGCRSRQQRHAVEFEHGSRVTVTGSHYWASYSGTVVGPWPSGSGFLVTLDNGLHVRVEEDDLRAV